MFLSAVGKAATPCLFSKNGALAHLSLFSGSERVGRPFLFLPSDGSVRPCRVLALSRASSVSCHAFLSRSSTPQRQR